MTSLYAINMKKRINYSYGAESSFQHVSPTCALFLRSECKQLRLVDNGVSRMHFMETKTSRKCILPLQCAP